MIYGSNEAIFPSAARKTPEIGLPEVGRRHDTGTRCVISVRESGHRQTLSDQLQQIRGHALGRQCLISFDAKDLDGGALGVELNLQVAGEEDDHSSNISPSSTGDALLVADRADAMFPPRLLTEGRGFRAEA